MTPTAARSHNQLTQWLEEMLSASNRQSELLSRAIHARHQEEQRHDEEQLEAEENERIWRAAVLQLGVKFDGTGRLAS